MSAVKPIKFIGRMYYLLDFKDDVKSGKHNGPIMINEDDCDNFIMSYAHLHENGRIIRYSEQIGTIDDIEFLTEAMN